MKSSPHSPQVDEARAQQWRLNKAKNKINKKIKFINKKTPQILSYTTAVAVI